MRRTDDDDDKEEEGEEERKGLTDKRSQSVFQLESMPVRRTEAALLLLRLCLSLSLCMQVLVSL